MRRISFWLLILLLGAAPGTSRALEHRLTLLFTNDHHGQLLPLKDGSGGVSRRYTLIQQIRAEVGPSRVLLVDAGDLFTGTALSGLTRGEADAAAYQLMGYDAVALGNHDFDYGKEGVRNARLKYRVPWVSTNTVDRGTHQNFMKAYVFKSCGLKVGIIGLTTPDTPRITAKGRTAGLVFNPPSAVVKGMRTLLAKESSVFIALSHLGLEEDRKLAKLDPFLHVIVGGHDHRVLEQPVVQLRKDGSADGPFVVQAGSRGEYLGRLDLTFRGNKKEGYRVVKYTHRLIPVSADIVPDPKMEELLKGFADRVDLERMEEVLGNADDDLPRVTDRQGAWGQLTADAVRDAAQAEVALINSGTFRTDVAKGPLNRAIVYELIPFEDVWVSCPMSGSVLRQVLTLSAAKRGTGAFLQVSGLKVKQEGDALEIQVGSEPLDDQRTYLVAMNDYLADGKDGYVPLAKLKSQCTRGAAIRDLVVKALQAKGSLSPGHAKKNWELRP